MSYRHSLFVSSMFSNRSRRNTCNQKKSRVFWLERLEHRALLAADTIYPVGDPIVASDPDRDDEFGNSVAMTDDGLLAVVGAWSDNEYGKDAGAAYLLHSDGSSWIEVQKLESGMPASREGFGSNVAIAGTVEGATVAVGARNVVYLFDCDLNGCGTAEPLTADSASDRLGASISISRHANGETLVTGDPGETSSGTSAGAAFVFDRPNGGGSWSEPVRLSSPSASGGDNFGTAVAISQDGMTIAVGAWYANEIHIFDRSDTGISFGQGDSDHVATITSSTGTDIGWDVDLSPSGDVLVASALHETFVAHIVTNGRTLLAGNYRNDLAGVRDVGVVHMYDLDAVALPTVTIEATDANAAEENADPGSFTFARTGETSNSLEVFYSVSGSATHGVDYEALSTSVIIPAGSESALIQVIPIDDVEQDEGTETVIATISSNAAFSVDAANSDTITIADNDPPSHSSAIYVWDIYTRQRGPHTDLLIDVRTDSNGAAESSDAGAVGVIVTVELRDPESDALLSTLTGTTDSSGVLKIRGLTSGTYRVEVIDVVLAGSLWDPNDALDATLNDEDYDNDGLPDEQVTI